MKLFVTSLLMLCFVNLFSQEAENSDKREIVFRSVNVVPMDREEILADQTVVIKNGRITAIGNSSSVKYSNDALVIDGIGKYLMPGLAEMHAHVPPNDDVQAHKNVLMMFALHGITTIRGMLGHPSHLDLRAKVNNGEIMGPKLYTSGPSFSGGSVHSVQQAEQKVREQKQAGYDFLKIHPGLTKENFAAVAKTAKQAGIPFAGHISYAVGVWNSIKAGYQTIDHLDGFVEGLVPGIENIPENEVGLFGMYIADRADENKIPQLMKELKQHNVWVVPTQALAERWITSARNAESFSQDPEMKYMQPENLNNWVDAKSGMQKTEKYDPAKIVDYIKLRRKLIYECNKAGVGLLLGCDAPQVFNVPGVATHHELKYLVDAGLTPYEALKTGTVNVAKFYKKNGETGVVKKGAVSDLILINGNPLENISNTMKIEGVMLNKNWLPKAYIEQSLKKLEKSI
jgi:imidazolonepropionase-like amidohydrolase